MELVSVVQQITLTRFIPAPELKADELMRKMWDDELVGLADHKSEPLTAEENAGRTKSKQVETVP